MDTNEIKTLSFCAYLGPLFLVGLLSDEKNSRWLRFHLNQGACLFIFEAAAACLIALLSFLLGLIPAAGHIISLIFTFAAGAAALVLAGALTIYGLVSVNEGVKRPLPVIGGFVVIQY